MSIVEPVQADGPREGGHVLIAQMCLPCARTVAGTGESGVGGGGVVVETDQRHCLQTDVGQM